MDSVLLNMESISKRYTGVQALDSVNFEIKKGEISLFGRYKRLRQINTY